MKKNILLFVVIALEGLLIVFLGTRLLYPKISSQEQNLWYEANEINKTCPLMVDDATRLDNAVVYPNNTFQYNYTLYNLSRAEINAQVAIKNLEPKIIENVKKDQTLNYFKANNTTLNFSYRDRNGQFVFKVVLTADKYK